MIKKNYNFVDVPIHAEIDLIIAKYFSLGIHGITIYAQYCVSHIFPHLVC